ncbi:MAG: guanylate kinase [Eubacteriales bacterium]|nr:guanylate kinase [Eubacteriales bacterium]
MNKIFYIMGKSASGKDNIYRRLLEDADLNLHELVLYTTRPKREEEEDGREYFFVDDSKFQELQAQGKIIESRSYHTIYGIWTYFTADEGQIQLEKYSYIAIGTLESYEKMLEYFGADVMRPIYVEVEDGERLMRALKREQKEAKPKYDEMCRRFLADCEDFSEEKIAHAGIEHRFENVDFENCIKKIQKYVKDEK